MASSPGAPKAFQRYSPKQWQAKCWHPGWPTGPWNFQSARDQPKLIGWWQLVSSPTTRWFAAWVKQSFWWASSMQPTSITWRCAIWRPMCGCITLGWALATRGTFRGRDVSCFCRSFIIFGIWLGTSWRLASTLVVQCYCRRRASLGRWEGWPVHATEALLAFGHWIVGAQSLRLS